MQARSEASIDGIFVASLEGEIISYNRRFVELWGIPEEVMASEPDEAVLQALRDKLVDLQGFLERLTYLHEYPEEESYDEILLKDGRTFDCCNTSLNGKNGGCYGRVWYFRDITEHKLAAQELREANQRFESAFRNAPIGMALVGTDGRWLQVNRSLCEITGYSEEELLTKTFQDITHPGDLEADLEQVRRLLAGEIQTYSMEKRYLHKEGRVVWILLSGSLVRDAGGIPLYFIAQIQDITQRKRTEQALRDSEERFRSLVQHGSDIIALLDTQGTFQYVSPSVETVLGYRPKELIGNSSFDRVHPDDVEYLLKKHAEILNSSGDPHLLEFRVQDREGSWRHMAVRVSNMLDKPSVRAIVTNSRDIAERKRVEKALQQAEISARSTLDSLSAHIAILDHTGKIVDTNRAWREFAASDEAVPASAGEESNYLEVCERATGDFSEEAAAFAEGIRAVIAGRQETFELEYPCHSPTQKRWFVGRVTRFPDTYPPRIVAAHIDITHSKQVEEELQEANRRLSELAVLKADFTAMVTHELDTPLAVIRGYAEMLLDGKLQPPEQALALAKIQQETDMLYRLVADMRAVATIEREDFAVELEPIPVSSLLEDAAGFAATLPGRHPLNIHSSVDEQVWADPYRIGQVLRNLLPNAAKYSPDGAVIELRAKPAESAGRVRIEVADHGAGIHPEDMSRIFEKFGRGRDPSGWKVAGVGLGLYLSRRIVRAHGSDLKLESAPGGGSVFSMELEALR